MRLNMQITGEAKLVKKLAKLNILCVRYVERHTNLRCPTWRDVNRVITANKLTCKYGDAVNNLYKNIMKLCKNSEYLTGEIIKLKEEIEQSSIKELRFGVEPQKKFTEHESELDEGLIKCQFYYNSEMVEIKDVVNILNNGITESAIKQACQQERLLNTKKVGKTWIVSVPECRAYWNVPNTDESYIFRNLTY